MQTQTIYYCERSDIDRPHFSNYKTRCNSPTDAISFFKEKHGDKLILVYNEDFEVVWEKNG